MNIPLNNNIKNREIVIHSTPKGLGYLLTFIIPFNAIGIIYRISLILFSQDWNIIEATAETSKEGAVKDIFFVQSINEQIMDAESIERIRLNLQKLFMENEISAFKKIIDSKISSNSNLSIKKSVKIFNPEPNDVTVVDIHSTDRPGLLYQISEILYLHKIDILSFWGKSEDGQIRDTFLIRKDDGKKIQDETLIEKLNQEILNIL